MRLIIFGPQGSGKGTYASQIGPKHGIPHISTGDIFREHIKNQTELGKRIESFMNKGLYVPDEITIDVLKDRLSKHDSKDGFILDGFPRTKDQAISLEKTTEIDAVINLVVPEWIILERLANRVTCENCKSIYNKKNVKPKVEGICDKCGGKLMQRADETPEAIKSRLKQYKELSEPLIEYFKQKGNVIEIKVDDFDSPPEIVVENILKKLDELAENQN